MDLNLYAHRSTRLHRKLSIVRHISIKNCRIPHILSGRNLHSEIFERERENFGCASCSSEMERYRMQWCNHVKSMRFITRTIFHRSFACTHSTHGMYIIVFHLSTKLNWLNAYTYIYAYMLMKV